MSTSSSTTIRRITPMAALHPYETNWTIKALVTDKGLMLTYKRANEDGCVFSVELTDEQGTQIKATMFNAIAKKFYSVLEMGKVYFISKGNIKVTDNRFRTVDNDYEISLNNSSCVEEAAERIIVPKRKFTFVPINKLGEYVDRQSHVDVIGVVINVGQTTFVKRKFDSKVVPKRDVTIMDDTKKTVKVSLWNNFATILGEELFESAARCPVLVIKSVKVGAFQGISLSTVASTYMRIHPDIEEAHRLRAWYDVEGKDISTPSSRSGLLLPMKSLGQSMYSDRVTLDYITNNPSLGEDKKLFFQDVSLTNRKVSSFFIKPDQRMSYQACSSCNRKVLKKDETGFWCISCKKNEESCSLRYVLVAQFIDVSGEAWFSIFNDEAEALLGCSAEELEKMKLEDEGAKFQLQLKKATWVPHVLRISVAPKEYNGVRRQNIIVKSIASVDYVAESKLLLEEICLRK